MKTKSTGAVFHSTIETKSSNLSAFEMGEQAVAGRLASTKNPFDRTMDAYNWDQWNDGYSYGTLVRMREALGDKSKMKFASVSNDAMSLDLKISALLARKSANRM